MTDPQKSNNPQGDGTPKSDYSGVGASNIPKPKPKSTFRFSLQDLKKDPIPIPEKIEEKISEKIPAPIKEFQVFSSSETILIVGFSGLDRVAKIKLKEYSSEGLDYLRSFTKSQVSFVDKSLRIFPWDEFQNLLNDLGSEWNSWGLEWSAEATKEYINFVSIPDLSVEVGHDKKWIRLIPAQRFYFSGVEGLDTLSRNGDFFSWRIHVSEFYLLPIAFQKSFPRNWIRYSKEAKEILNAQIQKRQLVNALVAAEDAPEISDLFEDYSGFKFRPYQKVAINYAEHLEVRNIIAYDMGLGKSAIAIAIAERSNLRTLIVTKAKLKENIRREILKLTGKESQVFSGIRPSVADQHLLILPHLKKQYNIINYDVIGRPIQEKDSQGKVVDEVFPWAELINLSGFDLIIYDECHEMRNMSSQKSKGGTRLKAIKTLLLTGTPLINRPGDLYPLLHIIDPETFSSNESFLQAYTVNNGKSVRNAEKLREILHRYMIRRKKEDVEKDLPPIQRINHFCELDTKARNLYTSLEEGLYKKLRDPEYSKNISNILEEMLRMKQLTADFKVSVSVGLAKEAWEETEKKVIIFSQFKDSQIQIAKELNEGYSSTEFPCVIVNGDTPQKELWERFDKFQNDPQIRFLSLSSNMGKEGYNLTAAHTVIHNDQVWNPAGHHQMEARAYGRLSDLHSVNSYYVQAENTIDEILTEILLRKLGMMESIVDGANAIANDDSVVSELMRILRGRKGL